MDNGNKGMIPMKNKEQVLHVLAEDVSINEQASNDIFLLVDFLMFTSEANLNGEGVTVGFIHDFLEHTEDYISLPLYCDTENLLAGRFTKLGHRYSRSTGTFDTVQIGGFVKFWSKEEDGVVTVYGQARIPKRESLICERIIQLYELGKLSMSFEVRYSSADTVQKDGATFIDVGENNKLTGACICWQPAFPDAQAQLLVAEEQADESELVVAENVSDDNGADTEVSRVMPNETNENINAETQEVVAEETIQAGQNPAEEAEPVAVAEGEGASESGAEASEGGGAGGSGSDGSGSGGSGDDDSGDDSEDTGVDNNVPTLDPDDEQKANAEAQDANAEVVDHSIETHESVEKCPETGETMHVQVVTERLVETVDPAVTIAEQQAKIAELETKIAELEQIKAQYDQIIAEREAKALAEKQAKAKAFAEKQGLDTEDADVAEAVLALDYTRIAELSMAEEHAEEKAEPAAPTITLASFVEMEVSDDKYGGLLNRKKN